MAKKFVKGDDVLAKHPMSNEYLSARVMDVKGNSYKIKFQGSSAEHTASESDLKSRRMSRSVTRTKGKAKINTRASPGRKQSPGRSPGRSSGRSPGRPRRLSSGRSPNKQFFTKTKQSSPERNARYAQVALPRLNLPKVADNTDEASTTDATESLEGSDLFPLKMRLKELRPTRQSARLAALESLKTDRSSSMPTQRRSMSHDEQERALSLHKERKSSKYKYVDDSDSDEAAKLGAKGISNPKEFGGKYGAFFWIIFLPACVILPELTCLGSRCKTAFFHVPRNWRIYLDLNSNLMYIGFILFVAITSYLPFGKIIDGPVNKNAKLQFRNNAWFTTISSIAIFGGLTYKGYKISDFLLNNCLSLNVSGFLLGTLFALWLYVKGGRQPLSCQNTYACSNNFFYDFWMGRETNPRLKFLDVKIVLLRCGMIGAILVNASIAIKVFEKAPSITIQNLDLTTLLSVALQIIYLLDAEFFESKYYTSFQVSQEGMGYMLCTGYLTYPFLASLATRYLYYNRTPLNVYVAAACVITFVVGYLLLRISNLQKDTFRRNPFAPSVSHLETIPTNQGKKLIVSGLWGFVRHPNYLGDILMHWAISGFVLAKEILPYYNAVLTTFLLIHYALRDNARCKIRYGNAWDKYCQRVKYMIFKWIY